MIACDSHSVVACPKQTLHIGLSTVCHTCVACRPLAPGTYTLVVSHPGHVTAEASIKVTSTPMGKGAVYNFYLAPIKGVVPALAAVPFNNKTTSARQWRGNQAFVQAKLKHAEVQSRNLVASFYVIGLHVSIVMIVAMLYVCQTNLSSIPAMLRRRTRIGPLPISRLSD